MSSHDVEDPTRVIDSNPQEWIPFGPIEGASFKVLVADAELRQVVFMFKFEPGTVLPPHTHECHAIAYTIDGSWDYEGLHLPTGAIAYEPVESTHTPTSEQGATLCVVLKSGSDTFLVNHMPNGSELVLDMPFFKALEGVTREQGEAILAAAG
jgi:anti-sigma factor ChrR (cupin superfamily)